MLEFTLRDTRVEIYLRCRSLVLIEVPARFVPGVSHQGSSQGLRLQTVLCQAVIELILSGTDCQKVKINKTIAVSLSLYESL